jgi:hypothetical protein
MERRGVHDHKSRHLESNLIIKPQDFWSMSFIFVQQFSDPPHVPLTIDSTITREGDISTIFKNHKVIVLTMVSDWPLLVVLGSSECSFDFDMNIVMIIDIDRHHREVHIILDHQHSIFVGGHVDVE